MQMTYNLQKYQVIAITLLNKSVKKNFIFIGLFSPCRKGGEPILRHLLRYDPFAVDHHSSMSHASHGQQPLVG
jgi:hypothetical protein